MQLSRKCLGENEASQWLGGRTKGPLWVWMPCWQEMFWMETLGRIAQVWKNILYYLMTERVKYKDPVYLRNAKTSWSRESEVTQSCPTLCNPMDYSRLGSSVHGILQARELELVAILYSRGSNLPDLGIKLASLVSPALADRFFTTEPDTTLNKGVLLQGCTQWECKVNYCTQRVQCPGQVSYEKAFTLLT